MHDPIDAAVSSLCADGHAAFGPIIPADVCRAVFAAIEASRDFGPDVFLSQPEFDAAPMRFGVNPRPGRNLLERVLVGHIASHPIVDAFLRRMLGDAYTCRMQKVVCSVPAAWIPAWVQSEIDGAPNTNLGAYVRPQHRDITWFTGSTFIRTSSTTRARPRTRSRCTCT